MPYNNTPIHPPEDYNGTNFLPLARVQKIINADEQVENCSKNAAFAIAIAAEEFIWYLVNQTQVVSKSERRGSRNKANLQYKDIANTIARIDNLEFLSDAVPKTISYQDYKAKKEAAKSAKNTLTEPAPEAAQATAQPTFEHTSHMHGQHRGNGSINDVEMRDVGVPGPIHVPILPNGHPAGAATNGFHATPVPGERPPTSDGSNGRAVFDVVRNGFQMSPEAALHPRDE